MLKYWALENSNKYLSALSHHISHRQIWETKIKWLILKDTRQQFQSREKAKFG